MPDTNVGLLAPFNYKILRNKMPKIKDVVFLFIFSVIFISNISAQGSFSKQPDPFPYPPNTEMVESEVKTIKTIKTTRYFYLSDLSQEEIINFYRDIFIFEKKWNEEPQIKFETSLTLRYALGKGLADSAVLLIRKPYQESDNELAGKIRYDLTIFENQDILGLSIVKFESPKMLDYAPVYQGSKQITFFNKPSQWKIVAYLAKGEVSEIAAFYLKEMPRFKWQFVSEQSYEGQYNILDVFAMGHQNHGAKLSGEETLPGVAPNIKTTVLTLKQESKKQECVINIIQFNDTPEVLRQERIAPEPFKEHGNIWIQLLVYNEESPN